MKNLNKTFAFISENIEKICREFGLPGFMDENIRKIIQSKIEETFGFEFSDINKRYRVEFENAKTYRSLEDLIHEILNPIQYKSQNRQWQNIIEEVESWG